MSEPEDFHDDDHDSYQERIEKLSMLTVGVAKDIAPAGQITMLMHQIVHGTVAPPEIRDFTKVLLQVIEGERDPEIGCHLPDELAQTVRDTIRQIEEPLPGETDEEMPREGLSLPELLTRVGEACTGNVMLWQQLWNFTEELEHSPTTPPEIQQLAIVLRKILAGERQAHITEELSPDIAVSVNQLLDHLRDISVTPPNPSSN
ncbi:MAG: hypothetical protein AAF629_21420 [Chloroflexota bacterium]